MEFIDQWCEDSELTPSGEGENLGGCFRELDDANLFEEFGVKVILAYSEQLMYFVDPEEKWVFTTGFELGIEGETIWFDPLTNLRRADLKELRHYRNTLLRQVEDIPEI